MRRSSPIVWYAVVVLYLCPVVAIAADWYAKDNLQQGHDPSMVRFEEGYALMSTNNKLNLWTSEDAYTWKNHGPTVTGVPQWAFSYASGAEDIWAPDIFFMNGEFRAYYCVSTFGSRSSAIGYTSTNSIVPGSDNYGWTDHGHVFHTVDGTDKYNAIDADVVRDTEGNYWMAFGSFGLGIQLIKLDASTGYQASDDKTVYNIARRTSAASEGAEEGPSLIEHNGYYFLFTAWDKCCQQGANIEQTTYKTAYGRADNVTGPYKDRAGYNMASGGGTILMERYGRYVGPGGGEAFQDLNRVRFVHHYYDNSADGDKFNHIHIRDVVFTDDNWVEMGQPFLGRYLSAEAEHGVLTRGVSGDLVITESETASNGEYLAYINTEGTVVRLPMNIMQAGEYLLRYRYANGGDADATHKLTINGKERMVKLPKTGAWGTFPEKSVVLIPATLKRGGNFIEVRPGENFAELDRIDFLRVIRDTIPGNGFDNGIRIRLTDKDELAMKNGGYAFFENVVTDSIRETDVSIQVKNATSGMLSIRDGKKDGEVLSECDLSAAKAKSAGSGWSQVSCSPIKGLGGVKDFYLTASGISGEVLVGNIAFKSETVLCNEPCGGSSGIVTGPNFSPKFTVGWSGGSYRVRFENLGDYTLYVFNPLGQMVDRHDVSGRSEMEISNLPRANYIFKAVKH